MSKPFRYRETEEKDVPLILEFIKGIAAYENMSDEMMATEELLMENLFVHKNAEVIFALDENDKEVGFALFFQNFSTFTGKCGLYLEDLFVWPDCRGKGYGQGLIAQLARITKERGCARMEWCCLDWNKPSIDFYLGIGAKYMNGWSTYRLAGDTLDAVAQM